MALRGLTAPSIVALDAESVISWNLIKFSFPVPLMYTDAPFDITYDGDVYLSNGTILDFPAVNETLDIKPNTTSIKMSGVTLAAQAITMSDYKNVQVDVFKKIKATSQVIPTYVGFIDNYESREDVREGKADITWKIANHWSNWDTKNGRTISHESQQLMFPGDDGFKFAGVTDTVSDFWGERSFIDYSHYVPWENKGFLTDEQYDRWQWGVEHNWASGSYDWEAAGADEKKLPVAYGYTPISGTPVFRAVTGARGEYLWVVYALCEGEIDSVATAYIDKEWIGSSNYGAYIDMTVYTGTDTQAADPALVAAAADWTAACQLKGVAYVVIRYTYNSDVFQGEPAPQFMIRAKKILDPRTSTTNYLNGHNNALVLRDYATNTRYGKGLPSALLGNINASADICDVEYNNHLGGWGVDPVRLIERYRFNGVLDTKASIKDNVNTILFTMFGHLPWVSGLYTLRLEAEAQTPVYHFDSSNIANEVSVKAPRLKSFTNRIIYKYSDSREFYAKSDVISDSVAFRTQDNGAVLERTVSNKQETDRYRAKNLAATLLKRSRYQTSITVNANSAAAIQIEAGDLVTVTRESKGWVDKEFIATDIKITRLLAVTIVLMEYEPTVYDWSVNAETLIANDSTLMSPFYVPQITGLSLSSGTGVLLTGADGTITSRIFGQFNEAPSASVDHYDIMYKKSTDTDYVLAERVHKNDVKSFYLSPVEDGLTYNVRVYSVNSIGTRSAPYGLNETVSGKSVVPTAPSGLVVGSTDVGTVNLAWTGISDRDLLHYEVVASATNDRAVGEVVGRSPGIEFNHSTGTARYYWIRAIDTSKLASAYFPASATAGILGTPDGSTVIWNDITNIPLDQIYNWDDATAHGFNPTFSAWAGTYPDGYTLFGGVGGTPTKETTITNVGGNAIRMQTVGSGDSGVFRSGDSIEGGLPYGSFVLGAFQYRVLSHSSGTCGLVIYLYTTADKSSSVKVVIPLNSTNVSSAFATQNFRAGVPAGHKIFGIHIAIVGSSATHFGAQSIIDVVYDSIRFTFMTASWLDITGTTNAPADNATVGGTWDVNIDGASLPDSFKDTDLIRHNWIDGLDRWGLNNATLEEGLLMEPAGVGSATAFLVQKSNNKWSWQQHRFFSVSFHPTGVASHSTVNYSHFTIGGLPMLHQGAGIAFRRVGAVLQCYGYTRKTSNVYALITGATFTDGDSVRFELDFNGGIVHNHSIYINGTKHTNLLVSVDNSPDSVGDTAAGTVPQLQCGGGSAGFQCWVSDYYFHQRA